MVGLEPQFYPLSRIYNRELEDHYIVVNWDQRGAGRSRIPAGDYARLDLAAFVAGAHALIQLLRSEYQQDKVYVLGHSWGSLIGITLAYRHPEVVAKYSSVGQIVDIKVSEIAAWVFLLAKVTNPQDRERLAKIGPPVVFVVGRHDYNTSAALIERYCQSLEADKKLVWFEQSGHVPLYEESVAFNRLLIAEQ